MTTETQVVAEKRETPDATWYAGIAGVAVLGWLA
jgi:hypothetical protein